VPPQRARFRTLVNAELGVAKCYFSVRRRLEALRRCLADVEIEAWSGLRPGEHDIHSSVDLRTKQQIALSPGVVIKAGTILNGRSTLRSCGVALGPDSYIKEHCVLDAYGGYIDIAGPIGVSQNVTMHGGGGLTIGSHVIIGSNCCLIASNHVFSSNQYPIMLQGDRRRGISIGNNVWLGAGVIVLDGSTVGDNVVVGAGSIVSGRIPGGVVVRPRQRHDFQRLRY
jgi:acetyltransferase-like isoleucine patch superfamily enzyme